MKQKLRRFDEALLFSVQRNQSKRLSVIMIAFSIVGNGGLLWAILSGFLLFNRQTSRYGLYMLVALGLCALVNNVIFKPVFDRDRPCDVHNNIPLLIKRPFGSSFPSGHSATSFACAVTLVHMDVRLGLIALFIAFAIAFSRLYLFVHYPSDIIFGILSGTALGIIGIQIVRLFFHFVPIAYFALP